jgi:hypothetical protein
MDYNPAEDWQSLTANYRGMCDEELLELADSIDDLTETAKMILENELRMRGLEPRKPQPPAPMVSNNAQVNSELPSRHLSPDPVFSVSGDGQPHEYTWKTPLRECKDAKEAWQLGSALSRAGIESWIQEGGPEDAPRRISVAADQLEAAEAVASQPIPKDILEESQQKSPEWVAPCCPKCHTEDPVLESVDPTNSWLCEACGARWSDPLADPEPDSASNPARPSR